MRFSQMVLNGGDLDGVSGDYGAEVVQRSLPQMRQALCLPQLHVWLIAEHAGLNSDTALNELMSSTDYFVGPSSLAQG